VSLPTPSVRSVEAPAGVIVLRLGEVFLKGRNRRFFIDRLAHNLKRSVSDLRGVRIEVGHLRLFVHHPPELERVCVERLSRVFGVTSLSPAMPVAPTLDAMRAAALETSRHIPPGTTFKVESNRRDKTFPQTSQDVSREVGAAIHDQLGLPVDVHRPQVVVRVEIAGPASFVTATTVPGAGGLPIGCAGKVCALLSGGIDSPVAAWLAMKRGCEIAPVYFHSFPFTGDKAKEKVRDLVAVLLSWGGPREFTVVSFTDTQKRLRDIAPPELLVLLYRRMMMRVAARLADKVGAQAIVTGESLSQVASQTLSNLATIEEASPLLVLRPCLAYDKEEIMERAQRIGTFDISIRPFDDCCSLFVPKHPATKSRVQDVLRVEAQLDVEMIAEGLVDGAVVERLEE
jgi:thiamine biosynthesis protein ThiI